MVFKRLGETRGNHFMMALLTHAKPNSIGSGPNHHVGFMFRGKYPTSSLSIAKNNDLHAETNTMAGMQEKNLNLFVGRLQMNGVKMSRPCFNCSNEIIASGAFNRVYWTTGEGNNIMYCRPNELLTDGVVVSRGNLIMQNDCGDDDDDTDGEKNQMMK